MFPFCCCCWCALSTASALPPISTRKNESPYADAGVEGIVAWAAGPNAAESGVAGKATELGETPCIAACTEVSGGTCGDVVGW